MSSRPAGSTVPRTNALVRGTLAAWICSVIVPWTPPNDGRSPQTAPDVDYRLEGDSPCDIRESAVDMLI
jgi:hypothetical protein